MDSLITVIGNAVLDSTFMSRLLDNPVKAMDEWHFRLTKSEVGMLTEMLAKLDGTQKKDLKTKFESLQETLYQNRDQAVSMRGVDPQCPTRRCSPSLYPFEQELRTQLVVAAREEKKQAA